MARRTTDSVSEPSDVEFVESDGSEDQVDIFDSLTNGSKAKGKGKVVEGSDDDAQFIQRALEKHNKKGGTEITKAVSAKGKLAKGAVGGGSFQSMGLNPSLLRSLLLRGFKTPTPIQRQSIPILLSTPPRDLVGMARTGSGKTLAYMIPLVQRLGGRHATSFGARALVLVPARELALQVLKVGKDLVRGWHADGGAHAGDRDRDEPVAETSTGKGTGQNLRWGLVVGGEGLDEQFEMISSNPDVIIATPGRLLHLIVEMNLDLRSVQYIVFDEADRLFELGFATALHEILHRLPPTRQTVLFSATLPKNLVEFAKAGLQEPKLVRLDSESKISSDLRMAFFSVKQEEKEAALLALLRDVIRVPLGEPADDARTEQQGDKKKRKPRPDAPAAPHQTLIFVATKHHVEHISTLLSTAGYSVAHIYGALDQAARTHHMDRFRRGHARVLVVTDVAARGIDIPVLENVVNYDFPLGARIFVHRVGRTARAGQRGWAWSFITHAELPFLLDLQLFLGRPLVSHLKGESQREPAYTTNLVLGTFPRHIIDEAIESIRALDELDGSLPSLRAVMKKGHALYARTQGKASTSSYTRAKAMSKDGTGVWGLAGGESEGVGAHPVLELVGAIGSNSTAAGEGNGDATRTAEVEMARMAMLKAVNGFRPSETVFEIGTRGKKSAGAALMKDRRKALERAKKRTITAALETEDESESAGSSDDEEEGDDVEEVDMQLADEEDIETTFGVSKKRKRDHKDTEYFMSHYQKDAYTEKGYSLRDGATFAEQARTATFDLTTDEAVTSRQRHDRQLNWDTKKKKFVRGAGEGADNVKIVKTESGARLPASYRSGRFDEWKAKTKTFLPKIGEAENEGSGARGRGGFRDTRGGRVAGRKFMHHTKTEAKPLDPRSLGYERKARQMKKRAEERQSAGGEDGDSRGGQGAMGAGRAGRGGRGGGRGGSRGGSRGGAMGGRGGRGGAGSRYGGRDMGRVKSELKSADQIRKSREAQAKKKAKNARPSKKGKGRR